MPIDPSSPQERIEYILEDSKTHLILTQSAIEDLVSHSPAKVVCIDTLDTKEFSEENPEVDMNVNSLAYVIYTSGSTGKPKGVMLGTCQCASSV